jgi:DNA-binding GntR family transcriptional regulator
VTDSIYLSKIDMVTAALRELIMQSELRPGDPLRQRDLAERFNVSATPVREALRRLEAEGLVSHSPHSGVSVVEVDYGETVENYRIRAALESLAAELAAETATEEDLEAIQAINDEMVRSEDQQRFEDLNRRFHVRMYEAARSPLLLSLVRRLWHAFPPLGPRVVRPREESLEHHAQILAALRARDGKRANELTRHHILNVLSYAATEALEQEHAGRESPAGPEAAPEQQPTA